MKSGYIALLLVLSMLTGLSFANIYYVDDDAPGDALPFDDRRSDPAEDGSMEHPFDNIQEAIDAAADGDTIVVAPGRYLSPDPWEYGEIHFKGKSLRLVSQSPMDLSVAEQTVLCGVVIFEGTEDPNCLLQGFKIQNHGHGGILGNKTQATVSHCIISGNGPCGATVVMDVHGQLRNCLITDNTTFHDCGVLPVVAGCEEIINCTIANNLSGVEITNDGLTRRTQVGIRNCIIYGNQGPQIIERWKSNATLVNWDVEYCLLENWNITSATLARLRSSTILHADPYFVQLGRWETRNTGAATRRDVSIAAGTTMVLIEGDYHLRTEGWRWSSKPTHGLHWHFDTVTSPAIDAGHPMEGLGEEPERAPDDPEGRWGVNHAINLGAYGGTSQASLAPTVGEAPGVGAVDFRDYWPLVGNNLWYFDNSPMRTSPGIYVSGGSFEGNSEMHYLGTGHASDWVERLVCYCFDRTFYMTEDLSSADPPVQPPERVHAQYPQFLVPGSTVEVPYNPFVKGTVEYRSVVIVRGTLAEAIAGTSVDPVLMLEGSWPDVIAFKELGGDGAAGDPIAIFARGFGPLMISGRPIAGAVINSEAFGSSPVPRR